MIQIHVNPARVEKVVFVSDSDLESDFDLAAWLVIQPLIKKMNRTLRTAVGRSLSMSRQDFRSECKPDSTREDLR